MHGLDSAGRQAFLTSLFNTAYLVAPGAVPLSPIIGNDVKDDPILLTAVAGRADALCTLDRHFFQPSVAQYATSHQIRILRDTELLEIFRTEP